MNQYSQSANGGNGSGDGIGLTIGDYANGMPSIRLSQIPASFMRQIPWMVPVLLIMIAASWWFTRDIKREYHADGRILAQIGTEYVYDPASGNTNSGINITTDQITQTEADIIKNPVIIDRVISQLISSPSQGGVGGERFAPKLYAKWVKASPADKSDKWNDIVKFVDKSYVVMPKPKSSIINVMYKHEDGIVAVKALDTFMTEYLNFRNNIFVSEVSGLISEQRAATEGQLASIDLKIQNILNKNGISEFDSEQIGVQRRAETLRSELNTLRGNISAVEAALAASEDQLRTTPEMIDLQIDDRASQRLAQAELERRQLLAKYLPASNPVKRKEAEISEIRAQIQANGGKPAGGRRVGPNTVYQSLMTQRNTYQAQADSYREREITLSAQLKSATAKVKRMRQLNPTYQNLLREKATLEERMKGLNSKEQIALANKQRQDSKSDNIKIISRPTMPRKGRNMQKILFALSSLGSVFTVMMLALLRVFLDPKLYGPGPGKGYAPVASPNTEYPQAPPQGLPESIPEYGRYTDPSMPPQPQPQPAYAPAAAQYEPQYIQQQQPMQQPVYNQVSGLQGDPHFTGYETPQPAYAQEFAQPNYVQQETVQPVYPQGNTSSASANPYLNAAPAPQYPPQEYAGVDGNIPVLGTTDYIPMPERNVG